MNYPRTDTQIALPAEKNILFLWMPKCAGCSIRDGLQTYFGSQFGAYNNQYSNLVFNESLRCATFYHSHIPSIVHTGFLPQSWVDKAFCFAIVRNPWDRMVSLFHYLQAQLGAPFRYSFSEFIETVVYGRHPKPGPANLLGYYQANNLLDWLRPDGKWLPNHICRYERLSTEWIALSQLFGVPFQQLPVVNATKHNYYWTYYDSYTRDLIAQHFVEEIDIFGYTFMGSHYDT